MAIVVALVMVRDVTDPAHIVLTLLLVVIGGSVAGGRPLGFTLALVSTEAIDYYFQQPYQVFTIPKPLDLVVLLAFFATAFVTTELLARARQEAATARARASEIETLSRLGAETLRYASVREALDALNMLVCREVGADSCRVIDPGSNLVRLGVRELTPRDREVKGVRAVALPLNAEGNRIGYLVVERDGGLTLDAAQRRLLDALSYYAALNIDRQRLVSEAAYSDALRESQRAKDEVFAAVSHDLRTPLTTIKVLAQSGADTGDRSAMAIVEQADRLARLVNDLLMVSRYRAGDIPLELELNTVDDLIGALVRQTEGVRNGRQLVSHLDYDAPALVGNFDFVHTLRILGNLVDNALRHTAEGGTVELRAEREDGMLVMTVADRGPGVALQERDRIFEPFYRPADATRDGGHAGLGLSIARSLAERQGGSLRYEAREGGGSLFILRLPAADVSDLAASELA